MGEACFTEAIEWSCCLGVRAKAGLAVGSLARLGRCLGAAEKIAGLKLRGNLKSPELRNMNPYFLL